MVRLLLVVGLLLACVGVVHGQFTCDAGSLAGTCTVNTPKDFTQSQSISGDSLIINAVLSCSSNCSITITMSNTVSIAGGSIKALGIQISTDSMDVDSVSTIEVGQNGALSITANQITVAGNVTGSNISFFIMNSFTLSGRVDSSGFGYGPSQGPGAGLPGQVGRPGGGSSYGGQGSDACDGRDTAGYTYGQAILPNSWGSGGGNAEGGLYLGGKGGGIITISANTLLLTTSGRIMSNGLAGAASTDSLTPNAAGGASGGSINIVVYSLNLTNGALVQAVGGDGGIGQRSAYGGGAGGGGRIWVNSTLPTVYPPYTMDANGGVACYSGASGTIETACPAGYEAYLYGCGICTPGSYSTDGVSCHYCPGGTFNNITGATSKDTCQNCSVGTYSYSGDTYCTDCSIGYYNNLTGVAICQPCSKGTYNNQTGQVSCKPCEAGTYQKYSGEWYCNACAWDSISSSDGVQCVDCDSGYVSVDNVCTPCRNNTYYDTYYLRCSNCTSGTYSPANSSYCYTCPATTYSLAGTGCIQCAPGYSSKRGQSYCTACGVGRFGNSSGCFSCPSQTYSEVSNASSCKPCPPKTYSGIGYSKCTECVSFDATGTICEVFSVYSSSDDYWTPQYHEPINWKAFSIALPVTLVGFIFILTGGIMFGVCRNVRKQQQRGGVKMKSRLEQRREAEEAAREAARQAAIYEDRPHNTPPPPPQAAKYTVPVPPLPPPVTPVYNPLPTKYDPSPYEKSSTSTADPSPYASPKVVSDYPPSDYPIPQQPPCHHPPPQNPDFTPIPSAPPPESYANNNQNQPSSGVCVICYERPKEVVFIPCGHIATCSSCAATITSTTNQCVLCRTHIQSTNKIFI